MKMKIACSFPNQQLLNWKPITCFDLFQANFYVTRHGSCDWIYEVVVSDTTPWIIEVKYFISVLFQ